MRWRSRRGERFWAASSRRSRPIFALAIFFTFAGLAVLFDVPRAAHPPLWAVLVYAGMLGLTVVGFAAAALVDLRLLVFPIAFQFGLSAFTNWATGPGRVLAMTPGGEHQRLVTDAILCFVFVMLGYILFVRFIHALSRGSAELHTEVILARRIHDALVPAISGSSNGADYCGRSQASGAIGGDLVDVVERPDGTTFYVADVSGHGVAAGVLMAMLRSAARAALADGATLPELLAHMNRTICELGRPNLFATCAVLHLDRPGRVQYALAGHLPILRRSAADGAISELGEGGPPLGLSVNQEYRSVAVETTVGDTFLILTDGLTEVFTSDGRELGVAGIRDAAFGADGAPADVAERAIAAAARFGRQLDDQSVLIVRVGARDRRS
jgi:hypothetical protein